MKLVKIFALIATLAIPSFANAHTPLFNCYDNGDNTIFCEGGFSNGSTAAGVKVVIKDASGKVILTTALDENSELNTDKPTGTYTVTMDAGEGHTVIVESKNIVE